jgi:hypothetical protein
LKDNIFSKAIKDFEKNFIEGGDQSGLSYNCHTACILGTQGIDFSDRPYSAGNIDGYTRDEILLEKYSPVSPGEAEFGNTIITFAEDHSAIFFGRNQEGKGYVFEKPNFSGDPPRISTIRSVSLERGGIKPARFFGGNDYGLYNLRKN